MILPVSIKGIVVLSGKIILLENERREWELPGGRLEPGESPEQCLKREILEELGLEVTVGAPVHNWVYPVQGKHVFVVAYNCSCGQQDPSLLRISEEHSAFGLFAPDEMEPLNLPEGYRQAVIRSGIA